MYDADSLALTGTGIVVGSYFLEIQWLAVGCVALVATGLLLTRLSARRASRN